MKRIWILTLVLLLTPFAAAEESKAPSKDQCDVDAAGMENSMAAKTFKGLIESVDEMEACGRTYSPNLEYRRAISILELQIITRLRDYLVRHGFKDEFLKEDAAGER